MLHIVRNTFYMKNELSMDRVFSGHYRLDLNIPPKQDFLSNIKSTSNDYPDSILWASKASGVDAKKLNMRE